MNSLAAALCAVLAAAPVTTPEPVEPTSPSEPVTDEARARELRRQAEDLYFAEDFAGALTAFEQAMKLSPHPTDLFNIGRIHEEMGQLPQALEHYEEFVEQPRIPLNERAAAAERIEVLRKLVAEPEPEPPPPSISPVAADPFADQAYEDEQRAQRRLRAAGITLAVLGGAVAVGGGLGFGLAARRSSDRIDDLSSGENPGRLSLEEAEDLEARGRDFETVQVAAMVTGGALAVAGVTMIALARRRATSSRNARLQALGPALGASSVSLRAQWSF